MEIPTAPQAVAALATFVRDRLADVSGNLVPTWNRREPGGAASARSQEHQDMSRMATARQLAMVIVAAAGPFAPTSYSRARLIRQLHASGLLSDEQLLGTQRLVEPDAAADPRGDAHGAPR